MIQVITTRKGKFELTQIERGNWQFKVLEIRGKSTTGYGNKAQAESAARKLIKELS